MFDFLIRPFRRNFGIDKEYYRFIDEMFGFIPHNIELYKLALIHKSASQNIGGHHINNERLEFLGDAVIESVTSDYLYIEFPDKNEGFMTQLRAKIVSRQSLNDIARRIGLDKYVVYNSGGNFTQKHIYGDAFEAMIGAIYLDQGYEFVNRLLINNIFYKYLSIDTLTESETDFKSRLIEWCQKNRHTVVFRTRSDAHAPHTSPTFYSTVLIDGIEVGHGAGDSKKAAEQNAAASLSHEISDEECAELLDRLDKISPAPEIKSVKSVQPSEVVQSTDAQGEVVAKAKRGRRPKKTAATEEGQSGNLEMKVEKSEQSIEVEVVADSVEQPKKSKRPRRAKRPVTVNDAEVVGVEVPDKSDKSHEKADKPKRRRRTSKSKDEASSVTAQQEPTSEN